MRSKLRAAPRPQARPSGGGSPHTGLIRLGLAAALSAGLVGCGSQEPGGDAGEAAEADPAAGELSFLDNVPAPEDLLLLPGTKWVVTSTMAHGEGEPGRLGVVDSESGQVDALWPAPGSGVDHDPSVYPDCDTPPDEEVVSPHGVNLSAESPGRFTVYAVNHGGRESVEVFTVDTTAGRPVATWIGCVVMPEGVWGNGVVALPGGGFAVTKFFDPTSPNPRADLFSDEPSGDVRVWRPDAGWSTVQGSELAGPNGIELSPDGTTLYVAVYADRSIVSVPLQGGAVTRVADVPFLPDNLRWTEAGTLLVTGQDFADGEALGACREEGTGCPPGFNIVEINTVAKSATSIFQTDTREFGFPTVAAPVGDDVWVGTLEYDRIARVDDLAPTGSGN